MRTIKFRGKTSDDIWVYGHYAGEFDNSNMGGLRGALILAPYATIVEPLTVGQFTGLLDKNGKEIYEGDIIKTRRYGVVNGRCNSQGVDKFIVIYMDAQFYIENNLRHFYLQDSKCNEVIGNIHDNPELLKV